ncbi:MAG: flagellar hook-basal body protein [Oligoflexales bacterium]|nr:flagellar hook-basal body protein [Oligoflexales bacterium]
MLKNIYTPLSGAIAQERAMDIIANNLANLNTVGFKGDNVTFTLLEPEPYRNYKSPIPPANYKVDFGELTPFHGNDMAYVGIAGMERDNQQGPALITHNPLDLMIEGEGYFAVQTDQGRRFTRAGNLSLNSEGALVTASGHPILGEKGVVYLRSKQFEVNTKGEIYQDNQLVDRIRMYSFANEDAVERVGNNYLYFGGSDKDLVSVANPAIRQGFLEGSNVNAIKNLTAMIIAHRSYEAYQKAVSNYDKMMDKSSNTIGAVRV